MRVNRNSRLLPTGLPDWKAGERLKQAVSSDFRQLEDYLDNSRIARERSGFNLCVVEVVLQTCDNSRVGWTTIGSRITLDCCFARENVIP